MRKLVMAAFLTLDGVMQAPGSPDEDTDSGFEFGGWQFPFADEDMGRIITGGFESMSAVLLGRKTYEIFANYWPKVSDPNNMIAVRLNAVPKYVVSTTLQDPQWANTTVIRQDVPRAVAELKRKGEGDIYVQGSSELAQTLMAHDLIDEYRLGVFPVVLGKGKRLFREGAPPRTLRLITTERTGAGGIFSTYEVVGEVRIGSFA